MSMGSRTLLAALLLTALVFVVSCQTTPWWAEEQAALGDLRVQQKQLETREEVEWRRLEENGETPVEPQVSLGPLAVYYHSPFIVRPHLISTGDRASFANMLPHTPFLLGGLFWVVGEYEAVGFDEPPSGVYGVYKDGELERETPMDLQYNGRVEFAIPLSVEPESINGRRVGAWPPQQAGEPYEVEVELTHGDSRVMERVALTSNEVDRPA